MSIPVQILSQPVRNSLAIEEPYQRWLYFYGLKVTKQRLTQLNVLSPQQPRCAIMTPHFPVTLQVDASNYVIGRVLLQEGHPVCFTSHTLSNIERNYAQIEKECLAIVSCMDKWHYYLHGKHDITVHWDHQPQETIFKKPLSRAPRRLQKMMLKL